MNFLVTGGSGYLGSSIIKFIKNKKHNVLNLDTNSNNQIDTIKADVLNYEKLKSIFINNKIDVVIHNIAKVPITKNKKDFYEVNVLGTKNIIELSKKFKIKKFIFISSSAVYGIPNHLPITEKSEKIPVEPYGISKKIAEDECFKNFSDLNICIIRPRTIIGKKRFGIFSVLFDWISKDLKVPVLNNGENLYQFIDLDDLSEAIYKSTFFGNSDDFNIGADEFYSIRDLLQMLIDKNQSKSKIVDITNSTIFKLGNIFQKLNLIPLQDYHFKAYGENIYFNCEKAKSKLDWVPQKNNLQSLQDSYNYFLKTNDNNLNESVHQKKIKTILLRYGTLFI